MKVLIVLALVAVAIQSGQSLLPRRIEVPVTPRYTWREWQRIMASQQMTPKKNVVYSGTEPQPADAGLSRVDIQARIINGQDASRGQFPWQAAIIMDDSYLCGGSLISKQWVLTAAHCAQGFSTFTVILGATTLPLSQTGAEMQSTRKKIVHFEYDDQTFLNDIAVLELWATVNSNTYISAVRLPSASQAGDSFQGAVALVSGWGKTQDREVNSTALKYADVVVVSNEECASWLGRFVTATNICTNGRNDKSPCNGDSGGPLVVQGSDGRYTQVGVVSFGSSPCLPAIPVAYVRVTSFLDWISSTTNIAISA